ncbi:MAG: ArsA-related P-loop ATPase, partial [Acidimicrobiales bacterium]
MEVAEFFSATRVLIVAGKGGVGKTTVSAALARAAAGAGVNALLVEIEGGSGLGPMFGHADPLTYEEVVLARGSAGAEVRARALTPDEALVEYLVDHGMKGVSRRLSSSGTLDVVATAAPGIRDILILGKVKQLERVAEAGRAGREGRRPAELIIVDAPAAGHAVSFLNSARGLVDAARVGPIKAQAKEVVEMLSDATRCQVVLVTIPEETPVNEVVETAFRLEDRVGVALAPVVVNGLYPHLDGLDADPGAGMPLSGAQLGDLRAAAAFRRRRQSLQEAQLARLSERLPLAQLRLPFLFTPEIGPAELEALAAAAVEQIAA